MALISVPSLPHLAPSSLPPLALVRGIFLPFYLNLRSLVPNLGCTKDDYVSFTRGHIALVSRGTLFGAHFTHYVSGTCSFADKAHLAAEGGAAAVLIYNVDGGAAFNGALEDSTIPGIEPRSWSDLLSQLSPSPMV